MNWQFQKEIYTSRLTNKYWVQPFSKNKPAYKSQRIQDKNKKNEEIYG